MSKKTKDTENNKPIKMWKDTDAKGFMALCEYLPDKHKFKVTVSKDEYKYHQLFSANFEPKFGMDAVDLKEAHSLATNLAEKIEKEILEKQKGS